MAYYDNISDAGIHFTSSVPEGLEAYRFPCQTSTTENVSDADGCPASSVPDELEAYPFPCQTSATENIGEADIYPTSSVLGELEAYPFLCQMSATENISDTNTYFTSFVPGELEAYPSSGQMSAIEEVSFQADHTLVDPWNTDEQPSLFASSTTGFGAAASYEPVASTSYATHIDGYDKQPYFDSNWPAVGQHAQPNLLGQDVSFCNTVSEASTATLTPSSAPLDYWWLNQNQSSISTSYVENVHSYHRPNTGSTRTGMTSTGRYQPYGMSRARSSEHGNAEAGPSTLQFIPYLGPPTLQPSGRTTSETTANAEQLQTNTEEHKVPAPKQTKRRHRRHRVQMKEGTTELCDWARRRLGLREPPSFNMALATAAQEIERILPLVSQSHQLLIGHGKRIAMGSKNADTEARRRDEEREWFKKLSRHYPLEQNQNVWERPLLLSRVLQDLEDLPPLSGPSNNLPPQASTSTAVAQEI